MARSEIPRDANGVPCEPGIVYTRYKWHPTCPFCHLADFGKEADERPDPHHVMNCRFRPLSMLPCHRVEVGKDENGKPKYESQVRPGGFYGQVFEREINIPVRVIGKFPVKDEKGKLTGEEIWWCHYVWRTVRVIERVWTKEGWILWYNYFKPRPRVKTTEHVWKNLHWQEP